MAGCFNYLVDMNHAVIVDVEASRAIRQAEVGAARTMIERAQDRFGLWPERLAADSAYGSAENLSWLGYHRGVEPHIPVFDKSEAGTAPSRAGRLHLRPSPRSLYLSWWEGTTTAAEDLPHGAPP